MGVLAMTSPFIYQLLTSLKTYGQAVQVPPKIWPDPWYFGNYVDIFDAVPLLSMFGVSVVVTTSLIIAHAILSTMAAYAFAVIPFPGREVLFGIVLSVLMIPNELLLLPRFELISSMGLTNSVPALILPNLAGVFGVFLMRQFFRSIPSELHDASLIDGAGPWRTFWSIMLPMARSGVIVLIIFTALGSWTGLLWPLIVMSDVEKMPLTAGLATLQGEDWSNIPMLLAGSMLANAPLIFLYALLQRHFIKGIALSGTKG